jgi:tetratricopeptide (TPR) repeat protein
MIFAVAFILRAVYTYQVRYTPFFQTLGLDAKFYDRWARDIAAGTDSTGAFFMTPLYSYFLAVIYRLFGRDLLLVRLIQAGLGSFTAVLTYALGRELFDRRVGILSGLVVATYGALIFYDCSVLLTPLLVFLNVSAVYLLLKADTTSRPGHYLAAGAVLGMAAIGRAAALLSAAVAILWTWLSPIGAAPGDRGVRSSAGDGRRAALRAAVLVLIGIVVVVAPVTIRNYVVAGDFVPITSNGGINFYIGNGDAANGGYVRPEGLDIVSDPDGRTIAEKALGRPLRPSQVSGYWFGRAWSDIVSNPGRWAKLMVRKAVFAISSYELPQLENYYFQRRFSGLLRLPLPGFALVAPLGLVGLGMTFRRRRARLAALYLCAYLFSIVLFFVVARYRLPIVPLLTVLACFAVFELIGRVRRKEYASLVAPVVAFVVLTFVVNANLYGVNREAGFAQPHYRLGIIYAERGDLPAAIDEFRTSIRFDPSYPKSYLNLGAVLMQSHQEDEARRAFEDAIRLDPGYGVARVNLAMLLEDAGEYDAALAQIDTVLAGDPANARALKERGIVLYKAGRDPEEAEHWLREALEADTTGEERSETEFYLAILGGAHERALPEAAVEAMARADTLSKTGRAVEAADLLREAARLAPTSGEPLRRLALLQRDMGLLDEALASMKEALRLDPALDRGHYMYGVFLNEAGRHDEAILEYDAETRINPDFAPAHLNLALTYFFHGGNPNLAAFHYRRYLALGGEPVPELEAVMRDLEAPGSP